MSNSLSGCNNIILSHTPLQGQVICLAYAVLALLAVNEINTYIGLTCYHYEQTFSFKRPTQPSFIWSQVKLWLWYCIAGCPVTLLMD